MHETAIKLLDKKFSIKCPEEEAKDLQAAAELLNSKMFEIKQKFSHLEHNQIIMLAALTICNNFNKSQNLQNANFKKMAKIITALEAKIKNTVDGDSAN